MILIINVCKEKLHYYEFVKPVEDILKKMKIKSFTRHYKKMFFTRDCKKMKKSYWGNAKKIIICGTSLKDNEFLKKDIRFWRRNIPILGICAGMQMIQIAEELDRQVRELDIRNNLNHLIKKKTEIGYYHEDFKKKFLSLSGKHEVYHLHNNYLPLPKDFEQFNSGKIPQAIKHKTKPIYGVLFHPEVRNRKVIEEFLKL